MANVMAGSLGAGLLFTALIVGGTASVHAIETHCAETFATWFDQAGTEFGRQLDAFEREVLVVAGVPKDAAK